VIIFAIDYNCALLKDKIVKILIIISWRKRLPLIAKLMPHSIKYRSLQRDKEEQ